MMWFASYILRSTRYRLALCHKTISKKCSAQSAKMPRILRTRTRNRWSENWSSKSSVGSVELILCIRKGSGSNVRLLYAILVNVRDVVRAFS